MDTPAEKSTELPPGAHEVAPGLFLDPRLALAHPEESWVAAADLHYGYEIGRRRDGGLWPLWGMEGIRERLAAVAVDWRPRRLVLVGDVVDGSAGPEEACEWLASLSGLGPELVLVEGNHDRGEVRRRFDFLPSYETGRTLFRHGHLPVPPTSATTEIVGHRHPATRFDDGAGTRLKLPVLVREALEGEGGEGGAEPVPGGGPPALRERWTLPAFSPWAGGDASASAEREGRPARRWACGAGRVFELR